GVPDSSEDGGTVADGSVTDAAAAFDALPPGPDMTTCVPSSPSVKQYVDPALGMDSIDHGAGPGPCAYKTITYALQHATGPIALAKATYSAASGETLPFILNGTQSLLCDGAGNGDRATLSGEGVCAEFTSDLCTVFFNGNNGLSDCIVIGGQQAAGHEAVV